MRKIRSEVTVQYFIKYLDGTIEAYGKPQTLKFPDKSKKWKELRQKNNENIKSVGWTTLERFQSNFTSAFF